jgi:hypothetical protein
VQTTSNATDGHLEPSSTRTGSVASLIQQQIGTAAGEGAGSSSAHAAIPRSNHVVDTQNILDQFVPLVHGTHIGLVKHGDQMYSYMSHCWSPFLGLEIQTPTTPTNDVKLASRDTFSVIPSKILESSRRSQDTTEMLVQNHEFKAYRESSQSSNDYKTTQRTWFRENVRDPLYRLASRAGELHTQACTAFKTIEDGIIQANYSKRKRTGPSGRNTPSHSFACGSHLLYLLRHPVHAVYSTMRFLLLY